MEYRILLGAIADVALIVTVHGAPSLGAPGWSAFQKDVLSSLNRLAAGPFGCDLAATVQLELFIQPDALPNCIQ